MLAGGVSVRHAVLFLAATLALGGCGGGFQAKCDKVFNEVCAHQITCGVQVDYASCEADLKASFYCDPDGDLAVFDTCAAEASGALCAEFMPDVCYEILCSNVAGCGGATPPGQQESGLPPAPGGSGTLN